MREDGALMAGSVALNVEVNSPGCSNVTPLHLLYVPGVFASVRLWPAKLRLCVFQGCAACDVGICSACNYSSTIPTYYSTLINHTDLPLVAVFR
jgi:hypothetical protein